MLDFLHEPDTPAMNEFAPNDTFLYCLHRVHAKSRIGPEYLSCQLTSDYKEGNVRHKTETDANCYLLA